MRGPGVPQIPEELRKWFPPRHRRQPQSPQVSLRSLPRRHLGALCVTIEADRKCPPSPISPSPPEVGKQEVERTKMDSFPFPFPLPRTET